MEAARDPLKVTSELLKEDAFSIIEGWGGDEDEDVSIDSDEKDSCFDGEDEQLFASPTGVSCPQLPGSGIEKRLGLKVGLSTGIEDLLSSKDRVLKSSSAATLGRVRVGTDLGLSTFREQLGAAAELQSGRADEEAIVAASTPVRVDFFNGGCGMDILAKRLDARRFRKEFSAKISESNIPVRSKTSIPEVGRMRGSIKNDVNERKSSRQGGVGQGGKSERNTSTHLHLRSLTLQRPEVLVVVNNDQGNRDYQTERGRKSDRLRQLKVKNVSETVVHFGKDITRKRRHEKLEHEEVAQRKYTLRDRTELSKQNGDKVRRESGGGQGYVRSPLKTKRAKQDEEVSSLKVTCQDHDNLHQDGVNEGHFESHLKNKRTKREEHSSPIEGPQQSKDRLGSGRGHFVFPPRNKRCKKDEDLSPLKSPLKRTPSRRGIHKERKLPVMQLSETSSESGGRKFIVDRCEDKQQVKGQLFCKEVKLCNQPQVVDSKRSDVGDSQEVFVFEKLGKVFERRLTRQKEKENGHISGLQGAVVKAAALNDSINDVDDAARSSRTEIQTKKKLTVFERRPTRHIDKLQGNHKCQQSTDGSYASLMNRQLCERKEEGRVFQPRPTRAVEKPNVDSPVRVELLGKTSTEECKITIVELGHESLVTCESRAGLMATKCAGIPTEEMELSQPSISEVNILDNAVEKGLATSRVERQKLSLVPGEVDMEKVEWGASDDVVNEEFNEKGKLNLEQAKIMNNFEMLHDVEVGPGTSLDAKEDPADECVIEKPKLKTHGRSSEQQTDLPNLKESSTPRRTLSYLNGVWCCRSPPSQMVKLMTFEAGAHQCGASSAPDVCTDGRITASLNGTLQKQQCLESFEEGEIGSQVSDSKEVVVKKFIMAEYFLQDAHANGRRSGSGKCDQNQEDVEKIAASGMGEDNLEYTEPDHSTVQPLTILGQAPTNAEPKARQIHSQDGVGSSKADNNVTEQMHGDSAPHPEQSIHSRCEWVELVTSIAMEEPRKEWRCSKVSTDGNGPPDFGDIVNSPSNGKDGLEVGKRTQQVTPRKECCSDECFAAGEEILEDPIDEGQLTFTVTIDCEMKGEGECDSEDGRVNDSHNSFCESCRQGGELLCCDGSGCRVTYHLECTDPKLREVPSGNWYCPMCAHKCLSFGVNAVSKSVESIWDVRYNGQSSLGHPDSSNILPEGLPRVDLDAYSNDNHRKGGRLFGGQPGNASDGAGDKCIAVVNVAADDEEEIQRHIKEGTESGTSCPQRANRRTSVEWRRQAQRRQRDRGGNLLERKKLMKAKAAMGSLMSSVQPVNVLDESEEKEYFVKWKGISHVHNTWVGERELTKISPKVLAKFKKRLMEGQAPNWNAEWAEPQRLVDKRLSILPREPAGGRGFLGMDSREEWFVKWKGLGYEHCTWEPVDLGIFSDPKCKELEGVFERWCKSSRDRIEPQRVEQANRLREGTFKKLDSEPEWLQGGQLLYHQLDRLNLLRGRWHHHQNTIIANQDDQQDKLSTVVPLLLSLTEEYGVHRPILVVVPLYEIQSWEAEVSQNSPNVNTVIYAGVKEARGVIQRFELSTSTRPLRVQIILTSYEVASSDSEYLNSFKWEALIVDQGQHSKIAKSHRTFLQFDAGFRLLLVNNLSKYNSEELQQILFFVTPQNSTSNSVVRQLLTNLDEIEQVQYLRDQLSEHIVMDNKPVMSGLHLRECWVGAHMTPIQVHLYCNILTKHYILLHSGRLRMDPDSPSLHEFMNQLRLCCQHPYHVDPTLQESIKQNLAPSQSLVDAGIKVSGKLQLLDMMLSILHAGGHRVLILSQFLLQLYLLDDYMRQKFGLDSYEMADARHSALKKNKAVQRFNTTDSSRFVFLLRTGASGLSLKLRSMDTVIIYDSDLNPTNDLEYLRKVLHKVDEEIKVYRLYHHSSVEEGSMVYAHEKKLEPDTRPLSAKFLQQVLKWKVQNLLELDGTSSIRSTMQKNKIMDLLWEKGMPELENVRNILQGTVSMEGGTENLGDGLLAEEDGESAKEFWSVLLKDRFVKLQDREEQSNMGKGLRQRKKVQYSEEALALAPYSVVEEDKVRRHRRSLVLEPASYSGPRDKSKEVSLQSSPSTARQAESHSEENISGSELFFKAIPEVSKPVGANKSSNETPASSRACEVKKEASSLHSASNFGHPSSHTKPASIGNVSPTTSPVDTGRKLRMEQKQQLLQMKPELSQICEMLQVSEDIASYSQGLLYHVMNNFKMPKEPKELVVMVEISLCLVAAAHFLQALEPLPAVCQVGEKMKLSLKKDEFKSVYNRLEGMCKTHATILSAHQRPETDDTMSSLGRHESSLHRKTSSEVLKQYRVGKDNALPRTRKLLGKPMLDNIAVPASLPSCQQDKLTQPVLEEHQPTQTQTDSGKSSQETGLQPSDIVHNGQRTVSHQNDKDSDDCHLVEQPTGVASEKIRTPPLQTEEEIRTKLKVDKDQLLQSCLAKQKLEVAEFYLTRTKEREARQEKFEEQRSTILGMDCGSVQKTQMLRLQADMLASDLMFYDQETEKQLSDMNNKQRLVRDKVNALYTRLLQEVSAVTIPDLFTEAQSMGLIFTMQDSPPKGKGPVLAGQVSLSLSPGVQLNQWVELESQPPPQPSLQQQCQICSPPEWSETQLRPESQPILQAQSESQPMLLPQSHQTPFSQFESLVQLQPLESPALSQFGAHSQSQTLMIQTCNLQPQQSAPQQTAVQPQYLPLQRPLTLPDQTPMQTQDRLWVPSNHMQTMALSNIGSELVPGIISHQLERTQFAGEQQADQSSTTQQPRASHISQLSTGSQATSSQRRSPPASIPVHQQTLWHAQSVALGHGQPQFIHQQAAGESNFLPVEAISLTNHVISSASLQSVLSLSPEDSSSNQLGPDPLVHEENRLKREQDKVKLMFEEETAQIKSQYEKDAVELRKKYEGLLQDRHRTMEQKNNALKENMEKLDLSRRLAEALKYRASLDFPKTCIIPSNSTEGNIGGRQVSYSSGVNLPISELMHMASSQQTIATNTTHNAGRNRVSGGCQGDPASPNVSGMAFTGVVASNGRPGPVSLSCAMVGLISKPGFLLSSSAIPASWQNDSTAPMSLALGAAAPSELYGDLPNCAPEEPVRISSIGLAELDASFPVESGGLFQNVVSRPYHSNLSPSQNTNASTLHISVHQRRPWATYGEGGSGLVVASPAATVEHLHANSESVSLIDSPMSSRSRNPGASPPIVTEAVLVSVSPISSPPHDTVTNLELMGDDVICGMNTNIVTDTLSFKDCNGLETLSLSKVSPAAVNLGNGNETLSNVEARRDFPGNVHNRRFSQLPSLGLDESSVPAEVDFIYISDDD